MTIKELERKIDKILTHSLVVLARLPDGTEKEMSAPECVEAGADFIRCVSGNDLRDVDIILNAFKSAIE